MKLPIFPRLERHASAIVAVAFVLLSAVILASRPPDVHWSPDCASKYLQLLSMRFEHGLRFAVPYPGKSFDPQLADVPLGATYFSVRDGEIHMAWPALFAVISWPFHRMFGWYGILVLPILGGATSVWLTGRLADRIRPRTGWAAALLVAVATPVLIYSSLYWEHTIALALELSALHIMLDHLAAPRRWRPVVAGALVGLAATGLRGDAALYAAALFGAIFLASKGRERWLAPPLAGVGVGVGCVPGAYLNLTLHGHLMPPNQVINTPAPSLEYLRSVHFGIVPHILAGKTMAPQWAWDTTFALAGLAVAYYARKRGSGRWSLALLVGSAFLLGLASVCHLIDPPSDSGPVPLASEAFHGWLAMSPILAFGIFRSDWPLTPEARSDKRVVIYVVALVLAMVTFVIGIYYPNGYAGDSNLEWGPRYWLVVFPLMSVLVAVNYDALPGLVRSGPWALSWRRVAALLMAALAVVSVVFMNAGLTIIRRLLVEHAGIRQVMMRHPDEPLFTDVFLFSALAPEDFARRPSFYASMYEPERFDSWLASAVEHGMSSFYLATFAGADHPFLHRHVTACGCTLRTEGVETAPPHFTLIHVQVLSASPGEAHGALDPSLSGRGERDPAAAVGAPQ